MIESGVASQYFWWDGGCIETVNGLPEYVAPPEVKENPSGVSPV